MPTLKVELTQDTFDRLAAIAFRQRRPVPLQIEVLVMQAVGLWPCHTAAEQVMQGEPAMGGGQDAAEPGTQSKDRTGL
jgi:hypothetical protein